jgi:hypothetical protein
LSASGATVTALASALVLGTSAVADQRSTKRVKTRKTLSPAMLVDLARQSLWLNVVLHDSPAAIFGEVASLVLIVAGIVVTAHNSPHVTQPTGQKPAPQPAVETG